MLLEASNTIVSFPLFPLIEVLLLCIKASVSLPFVPLWLLRVLGTSAIFSRVVRLKVADKLFTAIHWLKRFPKRETSIISLTFVITHYYTIKTIKNKHLYK